MFINITSVELSEERCRESSDGIPVFYGQWAYDRSSLSEFLKHEKNILSLTEPVEDPIALYGLDIGDVVAVKPVNTDNILVGDKFVRAQVIDIGNGFINVYLLDYVRAEALDSPGATSYEPNPQIVGSIEEYLVPHSAVRLFRHNVALASLKIVPPLGRAFCLDKEFAQYGIQQIYDKLNANLCTIQPFELNSEDDWEGVETINKIHVVTKLCGFTKASLVPDYDAIKINIEHQDYHEQYREPTEAEESYSPPDINPNFSPDLQISPPASAGFGRGKFIHRNEENKAEELVPGLQVVSLNRRGRGRGYGRVQRMLLNEAVAGKGSVDQVIEESTDINILRDLIIYADLPQKRKAALNKFEKILLEKSSSEEGSI